MRFFKAIFSAIGLALLAPVVISPAQAQGQNGRGVGQDQVSIAYYSVKPGLEDEWLALYKKWHRPIIEHELKEGVRRSSTLYSSGNHAQSPKWDFAIISIAPPAGTGPKPSLSRAQLIRKLYPDLNAYAAGERERWALTVEHWDEKLVQLDFTQEPLSVYYPVEGGAGK